MNSIANMIQALRLNSSKDLPQVTLKPTSLLFPKDPRDTKASNEKAILREIPLKEVDMHDEINDCWVVIYDRVYDVTQFLRSHPGGEDIIIGYGGRDATLAFRGKGHSKDAISMMKDYLIGQLPESECIFRTPHVKVLMSDIPE